MILLCSSLVLAVPMSFSDQGTGLTLSGVEVASGDLGITIWDSATGGTLLYNETFSGAIVNGSWNVIMNDSLLELEFGVQYWKDYTINGTDLDFDGDERISLYSSLGLINNQSFVNGSTVSGWETNTSRTWTNQSVGIGISAVANTGLHIRHTGAGSVDHPLLVQGDGPIVEMLVESVTDNNADFTLRRNSGLNSSFTFRALANGAFDIRDGLDAATRLHIDTDGNIGIGTTTPTERLEVVGGFVRTGDTSLTNTKHYIENRTVGTTAGDVTDIGSFTFENGAGMIEIDYVAHVASYSIAAKYIIPVQYENLDQGLDNQWLRVHPVAYTGQYNTNEVEIDINVNNAIAQLRLRRVGGLQNPTHILDIKTVGSNVTFTPSTTTGSGESAPSLPYGPSVLTQRSGRVGINTTDPGEVLEVVGNINASGDVCITGGNCLSTSSPWNGSGTVELSDPNDNVSANSLIIDNTNGRVGINIPGSDPEGRLHVYTAAVAATAEAAADELILEGFNTGVTILSDNTSTGTINYGDAQDANVGSIQYAHTDDSLSITTNGSQQITVDSVGNVGIGVTTPTESLHVTGNIYAAGSLIMFPGSNKYPRISRSNDNLVFSVNAAGEVMRVVDTGNVGIGTNEPARTLEVLDDTNPQLRLTHTNGTNYTDFQTQANGDLLIDVSGTAIYTNDDFLVTGTGTRVGIGTASPGDHWAPKVRVVHNGNSMLLESSETDPSSLIIGISNSSNGHYIQSTKYESGTTVPLRFLMVNTEVMRLDTTGFIGIGTTVPTTILDVNGTVNVQGNISMPTNFWIGSGSTATGGNSIALGNSADATGTNSISIGVTSEASGSSGTVAVGPLTLANVTGSTAVGSAAQATGTTSTAYGSDALASGASSLAVGNEAVATDSNSIALGVLSNSSDQSAIAIGLRSLAQGQDAVSIGVDTSSALRGIAIGVEANSSLTGDIAIGYDAEASGSVSVAAGYRSYAGYSYTTALGADARAENVRATAFGAGANATQNQALAVGSFARAASLNAIAIGGGQTPASREAAEALDTEAIAIGFNTTADQENSVALGAHADTDSDNQFMIGSTAENLNTFIHGSLNVSNSSFDVCITGGNCLSSVGGSGNISGSGATNRIAFYDGVDSLSGRADFLLNPTNGRVSFNTTTSNHGLNMRGTIGFSDGNGMITSDDSGSFLTLRAGGALYNGAILTYASAIRVNGYDGSSTLNIKSYNDTDRRGITIAASDGQTLELLRLVNDSGDVLTVFDETGQLGIGTGDPAGLLHFNDSDPYTVEFTLDGEESYDLSHGVSGLFFRLDNVVAYGLTQDHNLWLYNRSGVPYARFDADSQRLGLRTGTYPEATLHINGTVKFDQFTSCTALETNASGNLVCGTDDVNGSSSGSSGFNDTGTVVTLIDQTDNVTAGNLTIDNTNGRMGIGTTSPDSTLHIINPGATSSRTSRVIIEGAAGAATGQPQLLINQSSTNGNSHIIQAYAGSTSIFTLENEGDIVAAGNFQGEDILVNDADVYSISGDLHVSGEDSLYFVMDRSDNDASSAIIFGKDTALETAPAAADEFMRITDDGYVGINESSPARNLHISDVMRLEPRSSAPTSASQGDIYSDSDSGALCYYNSTAWVDITGVGGACA